MKTIDLNAALQLLETQPLTPYFTFDDINVFSEDNGQVHFWLDAYLICKNPQGGEIYARLYADCVYQDGSVLIKVNNDSLDIRTEDLEILDADNKYLDMDSDNLVKQAFQQKLQFGNDEWEARINQQFTDEFKQSYQNNFSEYGINLKNWINYIFRSIP